MKILMSILIFLCGSMSIAKEKAVTTTRAPNSDYVPSYFSFNNAGSSNGTISCPKHIMDTLRNFVTASPGENEYSIQWIEQIANGAILITLKRGGGIAETAVYNIQPGAGCMFMASGKK